MDEKGRYLCACVVHVFGIGRGGLLDFYGWTLDDAVGHAE